MFKRPKDVEHYIAIWGLMDSVVCATKKGKALSYWKRNSVPVDANGSSFRIRCSDGIRKLQYAHIAANRYWYKEFFSEDMLHYERLYSVFSHAIGME